eukprot:SM000019S05075  [mRNA]  locus=s19:812236:815425:+ [translate_table: standard]
MEVYMPAAAGSRLPLVAAYHDHKPSGPDSVSQAGECQTPAREALDASLRGSGFSSERRPARTLWPVSATQFQWRRGRSKARCRLGDAVVDNRDWDGRNQAGQDTALAQLSGEPEQPTLGALNGLRSRASATSPAVPPATAHNVEASEDSQRQPSGNASDVELSHNLGTQANGTYRPGQEVKLLAVESAGLADDQGRPLTQNGRLPDGKEQRKRRRSKQIGRGKDEGGVVRVDGHRIGQRGILQKLFWTFGRWLYLFWFAQDTTGLCNLPIDRGFFLLASNHSSHLDCGAIFIGAWAGGIDKVYALGAQDYFFRHPLKAWFVTTFMNVIPFNRRGFSQREVEILQRIQDASSAESPAAVVMFPEGTRSKDGSLHQFKTGVSFLAETLNMPIVPGTLGALPKGRLVPFRHKVEVEFGAPLWMSRSLKEKPEDSVRAVSGAKPLVGRHHQSGRDFEPELQARLTDLESQHLRFSTKVTLKGGASDKAIADERGRRRALQAKFAKDLQASVRRMLIAKQARVSCSKHLGMESRLWSFAKWFRILTAIITVTALGILQTVHPGSTTSRLASLTQGTIQRGGAAHVMLVSTVVAMASSWLLQLLAPYFVLTSPAS